MRISDNLGNNAQLNCFQRIVDKLKSELSGLPPISPMFGKSQTVRAAMNEYAARNNWHKKVGINSNITGSKHNSNYFVEYMHDFMCTKCDAIHRINLELCFDNRQCIPANLLKLDMANANFINKRGGKSLGIVLCLSLNAKQIGKWDNSVATFEEYLLALETGYSAYLRTNLALLSIEA